MSYFLLHNVKLIWLLSLLIFDKDNNLHQLVYVEKFFEIYVSALWSRTILPILQNFTQKCNQKVNHEQQSSKWISYNHILKGEQSHNVKTKLPSKCNNNIAFRLHYYPKGFIVNHIAIELAIYFNNVLK